MFSQWIHQFTFPPTVYKGSPFSTSSPTLVICGLFDDSHLTGVRQYLTVVLICISLMISDVEHLFICLLANPMSASEKVSSGLLPIILIVFFFFLILSCMSCFYILDINLLLFISFANIFSQSVGCLFVLSMVLFAVPNLLKVNFVLFTFVFVSYVLGDRSKKMLLPRLLLLKIVLPMFSFRSFMISSLTFRSLINFECIFVYGVRKCSISFFYM